MLSCTAAHCGRPAVAARRRRSRFPIGHIRQFGRFGSRAGRTRAMGDATDAAAFLASIQRDLNGISDADRSTRRRAFDALTKRYVIPDGRTIAPFSFDFSTRDARRSRDARCPPLYRHADVLTPPPTSSPPTTPESPGGIDANEQALRRRRLEAVPLGRDARRARAERHPRGGARRDRFGGEGSRVVFRARRAVRRAVRRVVGTDTQDARTGAHTRDGRRVGGGAERGDPAGARDARRRNLRAFERRGRPGVFRG